MEEMLFCPSCMAKAESPDGVCPVCGGDMHIATKIDRSVNLDKVVFNAS